MPKGDKRVEKERVHINLARLKVQGNSFEIVVDPDKAMQYKTSKGIDIRDVLSAEKIFADAQNGMLASEHQMQALFDTTDPLKVAEKILMEGEIQLTSEYREKLREEKEKRIISLIHINSADPLTHFPHPIIRIENAMREAKVRIDEFKKPEDQIQGIIKQLQPILPIKFESRQIMVKIGPEYATKAYSVLKNYGQAHNRDEWQNDGSLITFLEMPAGMVQDFFDQLNKATKGSAETKIIEKR